MGCLEECHCSTRTNWVVRLIMTGGCGSSSTLLVITGFKVPDQGKLNRTSVKLQLRIEPHTFHAQVRHFTVELNYVISCKKTSGRRENEKHSYWNCGSWMLVVLSVSLMMFIWKSCLNLFKLLNMWSFYRKGIGWFICGDYVGEACQQNQSSADEAWFTWWIYTDAVCVSTRDGCVFQLPHSVHESV
jgi:hypothetical protein